ncbi:hypothetical protein Acr_03g0006060 [Actinidia rufa]|uniref:Saposin B-type domain-containing protein n=1 Tax=Actinidia rufa TaxID=165716 RepID=A0A7J0EBY7_9ERIC|nr:hypothetical protein Acr_03g0006060 [Actinidia rufa]
MGVTAGVFVLFVLGTCWTSDAREIMTSGLSGRETLTSDGSAFVSMALKYLKQSKTPLEMFNTIRESCSQMGSYKQQCTTMVDDFGSQLMMGIATMQPGFLCGKFNFSEHNTLMTSSLRSLDQSSLVSLDWCQICHGVVAEVIVQLKDPDTRAAIIQGMQSACNFARNYAGMCHALVSGIGPLALLEVEKFLESRDLCTTFRVCNSTSASSPQPSVIAKPPMAMVSV